MDSPGLDELTPDEQAFEDELMEDDGAAARAHLEAGRAIYYIEPTTPDGLIVREHPGGRRELVRADRRGGEPEIVRAL